MRNILAIAAKDLRSQFVSPIAYVVLTGYLLLGGWFFFNLLARFNFLLNMYLSFRNPEAMERLNLNEFVIAPLLHNLSVILVGHRSRDISLAVDRSCAGPRDARNN